MLNFKATTYSKSLKKTLEHVPELRHGVVAAQTSSGTSPGSKLADCAGSSRVFSPCDVSFTGKNGTNCPLSLTSYTGHEIKAHKFSLTLDLLILINVSKEQILQDY